MHVQSLAVHRVYVNKAMHHGIPSKRILCFWCESNIHANIRDVNGTEGEQTLCWRFDDELWPRFRNVTFIQLCIFCFFDRNSGQYVSKHRHFIMVWYVNGISAKNLASKRAIYDFFAIIRQQQKTRFLHVHLSM